MVLSFVLCFVFFFGVFFFVFKTPKIVFVLKAESWLVRFGPSALSEPKLLSAKKKPCSVEIRFGFIFSGSEVREAAFKSATDYVIGFGCAAFVPF